jgi:hypothetical protein
MNEQKELTEVLDHDFSLSIKGNISFEELKLLLAERINYLINNNFQELIRLLYRIDIDEHRLKYMLEESEVNAGTLIADLIIERQLQKIASRKKYKTNDNESNEEKW